MGKIILIIYSLCYLNNGIQEKFYTVTQYDDQKCFTEITKLEAENYKIQGINVDTQRVNVKSLIYIK